MSVELANAQDDTQSIDEPTRTMPQHHDKSDHRALFVGYETLEMAMNRFKNFAGELGYRFNSRFQARLTIMEVSLTERHLSSRFEAAAIDGDGVTGYFRGYEAHLQWYPWRRLYLSGGIGYYHDMYDHKKSGEVLRNHTPTVGVGVGYTWNEPLGIPYLYADAAMPFRFYFNSIDETRLGGARVRTHLIVNNLWLFLGVSKRL